MRSSHSLDRLDTAFNDDRLVADAGLLLPATLAQHLGLRELVETHLDLGQAPGRANVGDKLLTLVMSALAGGDCIDDVAALRAGGSIRAGGSRSRRRQSSTTWPTHRRAHADWRPRTAQRVDARSEVRVPHHDHVCLLY